MVDKVCCLVYNKSETGEAKFLIVHRNGWWNGWELLRGDAYNNPYISALKTISESSGLNIEKVNQLPYNYSYEYLKGLNFVDANVMCFSAKSDEKNIQLDKEHDYYKWATFDEAMNLIDFEEQKKMLEFFRKFI